MSSSLSLMVSSVARRRLQRCSACRRDTRVNAASYVGNPVSKVFHSNRSFRTSSLTKKEAATGATTRPVGFGKLSATSRANASSATSTETAGRFSRQGGHDTFTNGTESNRVFSSLAPLKSDEFGDGDEAQDLDSWILDIDDEINRLAAADNVDYDLRETSHQNSMRDSSSSSSTLSSSSSSSFAWQGEQQHQQQGVRSAGPSSSLRNMEFGGTFGRDNPPASSPLPPPSSAPRQVPDESSSSVSPLLRALQAMDSAHDFSDNRLFPAGTKGSADAQQHRRQQQSHSTRKKQQSKKRHKPALSPLAMLKQVTAREKARSETQSHPVDEMEPTEGQATHVHAPQESLKEKTRQEMEQLQLQLECESQREAVQKYQALLDSTRSRKDYASLNSLQKLILNWYEPVRNGIEQVQKKFLLYDHSKKKKRRFINRGRERDPDNSVGDGDGDGDADNDFDYTGISLYGPQILCVDPAKLAVIATHEALTLCIDVAHESTNDHGGCPVILLAKKIGRAVEDEIVLQRALKSFMLEERRETKEKKKKIDSESDGDEKGKEASGNSDETPDLKTDMPDPKTDLSAGGDSNDIKDAFSYTESRLIAYLEDIGRSDTATARKRNRRTIANAVRKAREVMDGNEWSHTDQLQVGSLLLKLLLENATIRLPDGTVQPAFRVQRRWYNGKKRKQNRHASNVVMLHDSIFKLALVDDFESIAACTMRYKPMVVPPSQWTSPDSGGYTWLKSDLVRARGSKASKELLEALENADLTNVYDGLNALSRQPWVINKTILKVAQECWENNIPLGDIPSQTDFPVAPEPIPPEYTTFAECDNTEDEDRIRAYKKKWAKEFTAFQDDRSKHRRVLQKNRDLFSLRCSAKLKLGQAKQFQEYEAIYFPYNIDFRGRAYPVPPHLSNVGSDLCRGLLTFAEAKPLGKRGLYWLQVHLANLAGKDKMTFDDRAQYTIDNLENVRKATNDPFGHKDMTDSDERPWWMGLDDPFQGLATCHEIINAINSGNPETYMCRLPVHMDGSCNGLQHYAALGLDTEGGTAVNLCDKPEPQDVYIGVMEEVIRRVAAEASRELDFDDDKISLGEEKELSDKQKKELKINRAAKLVHGLIDRGVVKRTVMTSVYGVTFIGARVQIQEKIEEKLEEQGRDLDTLKIDIFRSSSYLANTTREVIGDLFAGANDTMTWLTKCARLISQKGYPVAWVTPLGLPVVQPYRQTKLSRVMTALNTLQVAEESDDLPIHKSRSVTAFPPNYIHSLDSTHMLLTAVEMDRRGLSFSAVHDSFWTHPCDVDEMNETLRETFVDLYSQPVLEELKKSFELRYPDVTFPDLPEKGNLDLLEVKRSKFFFQ